MNSSGVAEEIKLTMTTMTNVLWRIKLCNKVIPFTIVLLICSKKYEVVINKTKQICFQKDKPPGNHQSMLYSQNMNRYKLIIFKTLSELLKDKNLDARNPIISVYNEYTYADNLIRSTIFWIFTRSLICYPFLSE